VLEVSSTFFFFSSRRRHTRFSRDWSSDVCSSDLRRAGPERARPSAFQEPAPGMPGPRALAPLAVGRSGRGHDLPDLERHVQRLADRKSVVAGKGGGGGRTTYKNIVYTNQNMKY